MKIKVENNLDEIVATLESNGYRPHSKFYGDEICILTQTDGLYCGDSTGRFNNGYELTTIAELRSMTIETLKEM